MCGRFTLREPEHLAERFQALLDLDGALPPRYNIAPTQRSPIVLSDGPDRRVTLARWGLVPSWAKDIAIGNRLINARAETLAEKPSFRSALRARRCLVPADGFYEWQRTSGSNTPFFVHRRDDSLFAMAGLYEWWRDPASGPLLSFTIITVDANALLHHGGIGGGCIHDRMPAILRPGDEAAWLAGGIGAATLLRPLEDDSVIATVVSPRVNRPAVDEPGLVLPVAV